MRVYASCAVFRSAGRIIPTRESTRIAAGCLPKRKSTIIFSANGLIMSFFHTFDAVYSLCEVLKRKNNEKTGSAYRRGY